MVVTHINGDVLDTTENVTLVNVNVFGEQIPKIIRSQKSALKEYKNIIKRTRDSGQLYGKCVPVFGDEDKVFALMFVSVKPDETASVEVIKKAANQLEYYCDVTNCCFAVDKHQFGEINTDILLEVMSDSKLARCEVYE